jgi:hypothetical protein
MLKIFNKTTGEFIGRIDEADLEFLANELEEESIHDTDYYIRAETVDEFERRGASARLVELLRGGLRNENAIEIRWEEDKAAS